MRSRIRVSRISQASHRLAVAHLLYEGDKQFVPITPLSVLGDSTAFFKAVLDGSDQIRAACSYEQWLRGCDSASGPIDDAVNVYELASSVVRDPMGGFVEPSLQQVFAFVRLLDILYPYTPREASNKDAVSVIASIAAGNRASYEGMRELGMRPVDPLPRWLDYEHRSWFPRLAARGERRVADEAHYLWMPPEAARALFERIAPFADGERSLARQSREKPGATEAYELEIAFMEYLALAEQHGSFSAAIPNIPFDILRPPPAFALLEEDRF
jgi:hypothetical protein